MPLSEEGRKPNPLELAWAVWRRRWRLAVPAFLLPLAAAATLALSLPAIYQATATVLVERQQVPEEFVRPTVTSGLETRLQTISQEILSRSRLQQLIQRFNLYPELRGQVHEEAVIERLRQDIRLDLRGAGRSGATIAFALSYRGHDPQTVAQVTNTLASFYIEENLKVRERQAAGTSQFLRVQLDEMQKRLDQQEARVSEFRRRNMGALPQQMEANLATLERLNLQLRLNAEAQARVFGRRQQLTLQLAELGSSVSGSRVPPPPGAPAGQAPGPFLGRDGTALRLARLREELAELRTRYSEKYPDVIRTRAEIALLEKQLTTERAEAEATAAARPAGQLEPEPALSADPQVRRLRQALAEVDTEAQGLKGEENQIRASLASYQRRVEETPKREQEFLELSRDYESTKSLYGSLLKRHEEAQIAESMEQRQKGEQFRILDPALPDQRPAAPNRTRLLLVGLALALGLAAGVAVLAEQLDTSFHGVDELRAFTQAPVLASIPRIVTPADARRRRWRLQLGGLTVALAVALVVAASYYLARGNEALVALMTGGK